jgi:hydroxymethylglutaryl-CoA lyase
MSVEERVILREVGLRDGLQSEAVFVPTEEKLKLVQALARAGVTVFETTSFVSPKAIPQLADAAELLDRVARRSLRHEIMVPNLKGAQRAIEAGADRLVVFISATDAHNRANVRRSVDESLKDLEAIFSIAGERDVPVTGVIAVTFGCPYQGHVPIEGVLSIANNFTRRGADRISLADTTGLAHPNQIRSVVGEFRHRLPEVSLCLHLHNNRGIASANLYAGYLAGVRMFDTSIGGIGGCPNVPQAAGNIATEDVAFMFEGMGVATGLELDELIRCAQTMEGLLGHPLPGQVMKSGPADPRRAREVCGIGS